MTLGPLPRYSIPELERRAAAILAEYLGSPLTIPVDVDLVLERYPGVGLDLSPGILARFGIPGVVFRSGPGTYTVVIDMEVADWRPNFYRFTLAEELGHIVLHRPIIDQVTSTGEAAQLQLDPRLKILDRNARWFASAVLMPPAQLARDARDIYSELARGLGFADPDRLKRDLVKLLTRRYRVSPDAMRYRLKNYPLKILDSLLRALREQMDFLP